MLQHGMRVYCKARQCRQISSLVASIEHGENLQRPSWALFSRAVSPDMAARSPQSKLRVSRSLSR